MVTDILLRLPVESLLRFKIICKSWYYVITSSDFIDNHFDHDSNHGRPLVHHFISNHDPDWISGFSTFPDETLAGEPHRDLDYLNIPELLDVFGPVKGIYLLCRKKYTSPNNYCAALLNPATREYMPLRVPDNNYGSTAWGWNHGFGFGFDPLTRDFKVVSLWYWNKRIPIYGNHPHVAVYSLANNSWKHLKPLISETKALFYGNGSIQLNGSCYWLLDNFDSEYSVLSFDMNSEVLRELKGPERSMTKFSYSTLVLHNDSLAMIIRSTRHLRDIDLLVMKDEGSWAKELSVRLSFLEKRWTWARLWKNNNLLIKTTDNQLLLYDRNTHEIKYLGIEHTREVFYYKESLVSLGLNGRNV